MEPGEESPVPSPSLPADALPSEVQPQVIPAPEELPSDVSIIGVSVVSKPAEIPRDLNFSSLIAHVAESRERTANLEGLIGSAAANLERLIWSVTSLLALGVGAISALGIFASHYHIAAEIGVGSAAIAGIMSILGRIRLRKNRNSPKKLRLLKDCRV